MLGKAAGGERAETPGLELELGDPWRSRETQNSTTGGNDLEALNEKRGKTEKGSWETRGHLG